LQTIARVEVAPRYCGPPDSGNGGYVAGLLASFAPEPMEVRLRVPPPLGVPFDVVATGAGFELRDGETIVATAVPALVDLQPRPAPTLEQARAAAAGYAGFRHHVFPRCFVCGPARAAGDGLRIFPGAHAGDLVAAPWRPDASLAGTRGRIRPEFLWAALDCPGYFAVAPERSVMLLGSLACRIEGEVEVGEDCVVAGWGLGGEGRKRRAATALYGADGAPRAYALATWIELKAAA
jgi:hypothetical protein